MGSFKITEGMFVLSRTRSKKKHRELVYYVSSAKTDIYFTIGAATNRGEVLDHSPNIPKTSLAPFWLQRDTIYRFKQGSVRIYDITPDRDSQDHIIAYKIANNSSMKYDYYSKFIKDFTELQRIDEP